MTNPQQQRSLDELQTEIDLLKLNVNLLNMSLNIYHNQLLVVNSTLTSLYQDLNISLLSLQYDVQDQLTMINNLQSNLNIVNQTLIALDAIVRSNITDLDSRLTIVETTIVTIQTTIISMQTDIANLQTNVTNIQTILNEIYRDGALRVPSYSSPPFAANMAHEGCMYYNPTIKLIYYCDGSTWVPLGSRNGTIVQMKELTSNTWVFRNNLAGSNWFNITTMELNFTSLTSSTLIIEFYGMFRLYRDNHVNYSSFNVRILVNDSPLCNITLCMSAAGFETKYGYMKAIITTYANELYQLKMQWKCIDTTVPSYISLGNWETEYGGDNEYSICVTEIAGWF